MQFKRLAIS